MSDHEVGGIAADHLVSFIERIETLEAQKTETNDQIKEIYNDARNEGFDPKIMRQIIRMRKMKKNEREEQDELLDLYRQAIGI